MKEIEKGEMKKRKCKENKRKRRTKQQWSEVTGKKTVGVKI